MRLHAWGLPDALRAAGLTVIETQGWTQRSHGELSSKPTVVWHHDASPQGDSPGALQWMINNWATASAQIWIDRYGKVYLVGTGVAWHAGKVLPSKALYDNYDAIGIETDHTLFEEWPEAQLHALRLTTAVILDKAGRSRDNFEFHSTICSPVGRKVDPAGLNLAEERERVRNIGTSGSAPAPQPSPPVVVSPPAPAPEVPWHPPTTGANAPEPFTAWPPAPYKLGQVLEEGDRVNNGIKILQRRLNDHILFAKGSPLLKADGDFGQKTKDWVEWFQSSQGIKVDGRVGPQTWSKLW